MRLLIVEDDPKEAELLLSAFAEAEVMTEFASGADEAFITLQRFASITGMITDIHLGPGGSGYDVARFARVVRPELPIVYMTMLGAPPAGELVPDSIAIPKPLRLREIIPLALAYFRGELASKASLYKDQPILKSASCTLDYGLRFVSMNAACETILGRAAAGLVGQEYLAVYPEAAGQELHQAIETALRTLQVVSGCFYSGALGRYLVADVHPTAAGLTIHFEPVS